MNRAAGDTAHRIAAGATYVEQITASASDRRARAAFQSLLLSIARPGDALFDFGCGTGMDARFYAERGFRVAAYDVDAEMCGFFAAHCRDLIEAGRVTLERGDYRDFLARNGAAGLNCVDVVTSNFAPLNLIDDVQELFAKFHAITAPDGLVLASVLSPCFVGDLKYGWWWRNSLRLWRCGNFSVPGAQAPIVRRSLADFAARSAPYFTLTRVFQDAAGDGLRADSLAARLRVSTCRFMFLLFEKRHLSTD
ncbi:MAG: hypothetical protein NVS9B2_19970 [Steroidobacteraceae bacterium]